MVFAKNHFLLISVPKVQESERPKPLGGYQLHLLRTPTPLLQVPNFLTKHQIHAKAKATSTAPSIKFNLKFPVQSPKPEGTNR